MGRTPGNSLTRIKNLITEEDLNTAFNFIRSKMESIGLVLKEEEEWKSTPSLETIIETNGRGDFRDPLTKKLIDLKRLKTLKGTKSLKFTYPKSGKRIDFSFKRWYYNANVISLPKFVATIYHPNLNNSIATRLKDGNKYNLDKSNVEWISKKRIY